MANKPGRKPVKETEHAIIRELRSGPKTVAQLLVAIPVSSNFMRIKLGELTKQGNIQRHTGRATSLVKYTLLEELERERPMILAETRVGPKFMDLGLLSQSDPSAAIEGIKTLSNTAARLLLLGLQYQTAKDAKTNHEDLKKLYRKLSMEIRSSKLNFEEAITSISRTLQIMELINDNPEFWNPESLSYNFNPQISSITESLIDPVISQEVLIEKYQSLISTPVGTPS